MPVFVKGHSRGGKTIRGYTRADHSKGSLAAKRSILKAITSGKLSNSAVNSANSALSLIKSRQASNIRNRVERDMVKTSGMIYRKRDRRRASLQRRWSVASRY